MNTIQFVLPGRVKTGKRPRINRKTKHIYNPHANALSSCQKEIVTQLPTEWQLIEGEVWVFLEAVFKRPKAKKSNIENLPYISTPDLDNIAKFYLDTMNGIIYEDDRLISRLGLVKRYCNIDEPNEPKTEITISFNQKGAE